ncbi:MAG: SDR family NAD(P)-dependent oxidoreductase [Myxococcota bacterium]|nr:SDR family NAD(P)-dependent oxidoreductase [Myxococcota bacterium]
MSTAEMNMAGKLVVVTGFTAGLGEAAAFALAEKGADLYLLARNPSKAERTVDAIRDRYPESQIELALGDLGNLTDVRDMATSVLGAGRPIDVLFNNAGLINQKRRVTADGYEETFAVNHLGHFLLTLLLLERLREGGGGRVVSTASGAHQFGGPLDFSDLQAEKAYKTFTVYGRSKLANILFTQELARREADAGITANCFHPGFVGSDFSKNNGALARTLMTLAGPWTRSSEKGAETGIYLCTSPELESVSGKYFYDMKAIEPSKRVFGPEDALTLWNASLELTGLSEDGAPMREAGEKAKGRA